LHCVKKLFPSIHPFHSYKSCRWLLIMVITMTNRLETNRQEKTRSNKKKDTCPAQKVDGVDKGSTRSNSGNKQKGKQSKKKTSTPSLGCSSGIVYTGIYIVSIAIACSNVYKSSVVSTSYLILESIIQTPPMIKQKHSPRRFLDNIQLNVDRGLNIGSTYHPGCTRVVILSLVAYMFGRMIQRKRCFMIRKMLHI